MNTAIIIFAACTIMGALIEMAAHVQKLWVYDRPWVRAFMIFVVNGGLCGALTLALADRSLAIRFIAGAAFGVSLEAANLLYIHAWSFPNDRLLFIRGRAAIIVAAGVPWGVIPALVPYVAAFISARSP